VTAPTTFYALHVRIVRKNDPTQTILSDPPCD
jgi:hypothetical protein